MKLILLKSILVFTVLCYSSSCKKDSESIGDFLPLKVGAKYLYNYDGIVAYRATDDVFSKFGECQWEFIDMIPGATNVYNVQMTFNGICVHSKIHNPNYIEYLDTIVIKNEKSTLTFQDNRDGKVKITFPVMSGGSANRLVERFLESSKIDTSFDQNVCLSKNIGIKYLRYEVTYNNYYRTSYTLLKGPF